MSIQTQLTQLIGNWSGVNQVWLAPGEPEMVSDATAQVTTAAQGKFLSIAYTWATGGPMAEDGPQDGLILLGWNETSGVLQVAWVDSWHMGDTLMSCQGHLAADGQVAVLGSYAAPPGPDWGWQIAIEVDGPDVFRIVMDNITPQGEHYPAVEISLNRQP